MVPHIEVSVKASRFKYLWLKYVQGFNPRYHCARCLKGPYSVLIPFGRKQAGEQFAGRLDEAASPFFYLCGVTGKWADNFHLVLRPGEGTIEVANDLIQVRAEGVTRVEIEPVSLPLPKEFTTCRNFQFGYHHLLSAEERSRLETP